METLTVNIQSRTLFALRELCRLYHRAELDDILSIQRDLASEAAQYISLHCTAIDPGNPSVCVSPYTVSALAYFADKYDLEKLQFMLRAFCVAAAVLLDAVRSWEVPDAPPRF